MDRTATRWGFPLVLTGYFALAMVQGLRGQGHGWALALLPLALPLGVHLTLRHIEAKVLAQQLEGKPLSFHLVVSGSALFAARSLASLEPSLDFVAVCLSLLACATGTLRFITEVEAPLGLEPQDPRARSHDVLFTVSALWGVLTSVGALGLLFPAAIRLAPLALDAAVSFACLGSLCLLLAAEARVYLLRGLELGTLDRARGGVSILLAALLVLLGAALFEVARLDLVVESTLAVACVAVTLTKATRDPGSVARGLRRSLVLILLGGPILLGGAMLIARSPETAVWVSVVSFLLATWIGVSAEILANPLRPERGRWIQALQQASSAALDADAERALIYVLGELGKAERRASSRPEAFAAAPEEVLSVDLAGYLYRKSAEFPRAIHDLGSQEPYRVLRKETLEGLAVRRPDIRPALDWFHSHQIAVAVALSDPDGPVGVLTLPEGRRRSRFTHEEAQLLGQIAQRFTGIVAVHSALSRSRSREEQSRLLAEQEHNEARQLREALETRVESHHLHAQTLVEPLRAASIGTRTLDTLQALESAREHRLIVIEVPPGNDPLPWVAHLHLSRSAPARPLYAFDAATDDARRSEHPVTLPTRGLPPLLEAPGGTLLILGGHLLSEAEQECMRSALSDPSLGPLPQRIVLVMPPGPATGEATPRGIPRVQLPALVDRPEDLQALIIFEVARIGLRERGRPVGIRPSALRELIERTYPGGEAELHGLLTRAVVLANGENITPEHLQEPTELDAGPERTRAKSAPRSRYS